MSEPQAPAAGSAISPLTIPKCPYCEQTMSAIDGYQYMLGSFLVLTVHCHSCRTLLHMQIIPIPPAQDGESPDPPSSLWKPS